MTAINLQAEHINCFVHLNLSLGSTSYDYRIFKRSCPHLSILQVSKNNTLIIGQDYFSLIRPIEYKHRNKRDPWGAKTPLGYSLSGSLRQRQVRNCKAHSYFCTAEEQLASIMNSLSNGEP